MVGKDRLIDDISDMNANAEGYWNTDRDRVRRLASILAMPDDAEETLKALKEANYIKGNEETFWNRGTW
jgi:hypothetical protein